MRGVNSGEKGFSLLETLVALALMGTILVSITSFSVGNVRSINNREARMRTTLIARSLVSWWHRIPDSEKSQYFDGEFRSEFSGTGLRHAENVRWRISRDTKNPSIQLLEVQNENELTVALPVTVGVSR